MACGVGLRCLYFVSRSIDDISMDVLKVKVSNLCEWDLTVQLAEKETSTRYS